MLNSLVAYADQIESKGKKIWFADAFAALPDQFSKEQLREALIAAGCSSRTRDVVYRWQNQNIIEKVGKCLYCKVKKN